MIDTVVEKTDEIILDEVYNNSASYVIVSIIDSSVEELSRNGGAAHDPAKVN